MKRLFENDRISRDLHYISVEHGIVLPEEISFIHRIDHDCDHAGFRLHHTFKRDLVDSQAALARAAAGTYVAAHSHYHADKWVPAVKFLRLVFGCRFVLLNRRTWFRPTHRRDRRFGVSDFAMGPRN